MTAAVKIHPAVVTIAETEVPSVSNASPVSVYSADSQ